MMQPYSSTNTDTTSKNSHFISSERLDLHMIGNLSIAVHALSLYMLESLSVDKILLLRYVNQSTNFRGLPVDEEMAPT